jgi:F0F1-type ATP synthase assembly protein I
MNSIASGKRLVLRIVAFQVGCAVAVSVLFLLSGVDAAIAALAGGLIVAAGNALFGWRLFAPGVAPAAHRLLAMLVGEVLKLALIAFGLWIGLVPWQLPPLPLILGLMAGLVAHWIATMWLG